MPLYRWQLRVTAEDGHTAVEDRTPAGPEEFEGTAGELAVQHLAAQVADRKAGADPLPRVMRVVVWAEGGTAEQPDGEATWER